MGGLPVRRLLAIGASQSAHRLASYYDGVHPLVRAFDGFLIVGRFGRGAALAPEEETPSPLRMRTDLATPVMTVNSESEVLAHFAARAGRHRLAPVLGDRRCGAPGRVRRRSSTPSSAATWVSRLPASPPAEQHALPVRAERRARPSEPVVGWAGGTARAGAPPARDRREPRGGMGIRSGRLPLGPPRLPLVTVAVKDGTPAIERDRFGNALGGIRLPQIRVPTAQYGPVGTRSAPLRPPRLHHPVRRRSPRVPIPIAPPHERRVEAAIGDARSAGFVLGS